MASFLEALAAQPQQPSSPFLAALAKAPPPAKSVSTATKSPGWGSELASAVVRPVVNAAAALPMQALDAGTGITNEVRGMMRGRMPGLADFSPWPVQQKPFPKDMTLAPMPSSIVQNALNRYTDQPQGLGKVGEFVNTVLAGARLPMPTGVNEAPPSFVPGVSDRPAAFPQPADAPEGLTGAQEQALTAGRALGMNATPGQAAGSKALQQLEAKLASHPSTSTPFANLEGRNQLILDRAAAHSIGEQANTVDSSVLSRANDRLGNVFENVRSSARPVSADPAATGAFLDNLEREGEGLLPFPLRSHPLVARLSQVLESPNAQKLGQLSSKLGKAAYKQMTTDSGDRDLGQALYQVKDHVDNLVQSSLSPKEAEQYADARGQYRNLMNLISRRGIVNTATGHVAGNALASRLEGADRSGFLFGGNTTPLYQAARFARAFRPVVGDSGTATRTMSLDPLAIPLDVLAGLGSRAYMSGLGRAVAPAAVKALPKAFKGLLDYPGWQLTRGAPGLLAALEPSP